MTRTKRDLKVRNITKQLLESDMKDVDFSNMIQTSQDFDNSVEILRKHTA
jgi:hypothetical protein